MLSCIKKEKQFQGIPAAKLCLICPKQRSRTHKEFAFAI